MAITISDAEILVPGFLDVDNPRSLVNIAPVQIREFLLKIPQDTFTLSEAQLTKRAEPDFTAKCLRINFWTEYCRAQDKNLTMKLGNILKGVTHSRYFMHICEENPDQLAWMIVPPKDYNIVQEQIFRDGLEKLKAILTISPYDIKTRKITKTDGTIEEIEEKKLNVALLEQKRKTVEMLSHRIQGSITKSVALSGTVNHTQSSDSPRLGYADMDAIEAEFSD